MVTGRARARAPLTLLRRELRQRVVGAAELERAHALQVLAFEEQFGAEQRVGGGGGEDGRAPRGAFDTLVRSRDVGVGDHGRIVESNDGLLRVPGAARAGPR